MVYLATGKDEKYHKIIRIEVYEGNLADSRLIDVQDYKIE